MSQDICSPSTGLNREPTFLFTSESVGEGHPDKICDQISDAILDAALRQDPFSRVAVECAVKTGMVLLFGEVSMNGHLDYQKIARGVIKRIGYDDSRKGFDYNSCNVLVAIEEQSPEIASSVLHDTIEHTGAGDQGIMFGYATDETPECMPLTILLAHRLAQKMAELRHSGEASFLLPDSKTQVTVEYCMVAGRTVPLRVHTIVISTQHTSDIELGALQDFLKKQVIDCVVPAHLLDNRTMYHIQPSGKFLIGGPQGDAGLTGRKIIVDTYGGWGAHGGGAFSGKDWSKVDRSGAYAARWVAKSLVQAGLCSRCLIQLSYAIGVPEPLSLFIDSFGTGKFPDHELLAIVKENFDLRPGAIVKALNLFSSNFEKTACFGHFGRDSFPWEQAKFLRIPSRENQETK